MMSDTLMGLTEDEKMICAIISFRHQCIKDANTVIAEQREKCNHRHVNIEHKRLDNDGYPEFYSNMRCLVCGKHWIENGSK